MEPRRQLAILILALTFMTALCGGLTLLLAGDQLVDFAQNALLRIRLSGREDEWTTPISADERIVRFTVLPGSTARSIGDQLVSSGLVNDSALFADYVRYKEIDQDLDAGTFFISPSMSLAEIAEALTTAAFSQITFTILPGQRMEEIAETIDAMQPYFLFTGADFLALVGESAIIPADFAALNDIPPGVTLEGFLYPETYIFDPNVTADQMRTSILATFNAALTPDLRAAIESTPYDVYETVTLASIVEREAVYDDEKPLIASVYRNRLEIDDDIATLDADPTVQYEHPNATPGNWWPQITAADYRGVTSPYNTYLNRGLPPAPIANPNLASIQAVIMPELSPYLFFRADCRDDFRHDFFTNYQDHVNAC